MPYLPTPVANLSKQYAKKVFSNIAGNEETRRLIASSYAQGSHWRHALRARVGATTGNEFGGGGTASAGPVTVSP